MDRYGSFLCIKQYGPVCKEKRGRGREERNRTRRGDKRKVKENEKQMRRGMEVISSVLHYTAATSAIRAFEDESSFSNEVHQ
jgi:hypothetical protein